MEESLILLANYFFLIHLQQNIKSNMNRSSTLQIYQDLLSAYSYMTRSDYQLLNYRMSCYYLGYKSRYFYLHHCYK